MKNFRVVYYAVLRQERGLPEEKIDSHADTARDLFAELKERHRFQFSESQVQVAVNAQMVPWEAPLKNGDAVLFIPPVRS